jgi:phenylalanyl-tRNA synthetase beta subunit
MKVSSAWIKNALRRTMLTDSEVVQALERAGIEVEQVISSNEIDKRVIVALVKKVVQHPGADRLKLVEVETGEGTAHIVCGAPNVRDGLKVALAQIGTTLPSGDKIEKAKLRGEVSEGMLCSEFELELGQDHNGILELSSDLPVGTSLCDLYPADTIIDIKTPANRSDVLSVIGLAREVAAMTGESLIPLAPPPVKFSPKSALVAENVLARRYSVGRISVDQTTPSPSEMVARLRGAGVRSIGPVVDITNYVMLETGQPLHAFDAAKVALPVTVRAAKAGETLVTLDGVERTLTAADLVIADGSGPIALAGVMGGQRTEVTADTTEILLESAIFDAVTVRKMAQRHGIRTEASARFERGLPVALSPLGLARAVELLTGHAGGTLIEAADQLNEWPWVTRIGLPVTRLSKLLGFGVSHKEAIEALGKLEIHAQTFDLLGEIHNQLDKPYKFGASYKTDRDEAFDCSYLVDYLYSLLGVQAGFTALGQYQTGRPVELSELAVGDLLFTKGDRQDVTSDHFFRRDYHGTYERQDVKPARQIGHVGIYVGKGKIVHASSAEGKVIEVPLERFTSDPGFAGARRMVDDLADYIAVREVPWWRTDLRAAEDLVEEIVRVLGYDKVPSTIPSWRPRRIEFDRVRAVRRRVRDVAWAAGAFEVMTYSFVSHEQLTNLELDPKAHLKLKNPLSSEQAYLRSSLLPSHLATLERNRMYAKGMRFYEISNVFEKRGKGEQPNEPLHLALTVLEPRGGYAAAKGLLDAVAHDLNVDLEVRPAELSGYAPGRAGEVYLGDTFVGSIGQLHPSRVKAMKIEGEVAYFEVELSPLIKASTTRPYTVASAYPTIDRDLALLVPVAVTWQQVRETTAKWDVNFVSDYYGTELPQGHKSLTIRLRLTLPDRTPTEAEATELEAKVLVTLTRKLGAQRRA